MAEARPLSGKLCLVTGANSGIGRATAEKLSEMGADLAVVCRNRAKGEKTSLEITKKTGRPVELFIADYSSLESVRNLAAEFGRKHDRLQVLVNNAGIARVARSVTVDGSEATWQVNYLAHFLLTNLLLGSLKNGAPSRIVNVSSVAHYGGKIGFDDIQMEKGYGVMKAYSQSKLALVLFTYELSRRLEGTGVTANCLHPGAIATNIWGNAMGPFSFLGKITRLFMPSPEKGAETPVFLASSPEVEGVTGKYFEDKKEKRSSSESYDEALAAKLWDLSAKTVGLNMEPATVRSP
jgi:retinol dehydrogenase 14